MNSFTDLRHDLESYLKPDQVDAIYDAYLFAKKAHVGQKRCSGEDYILHPVAVAKILAKMHMDYQSIMAALLHDVLEDASIKKSELAKRFGKVVADLVDGVTKLTKIKFESKAVAQAENFRKMILAMVKDIRVIIVKLADRFHNMSTVGVFPPYKRRRIAKETLEIYAPIANRLGMHKFYIDLEDLGFSAHYPLRYRVLKKAVSKARGNRKEIMKEIENELKSYLKKQEFTHEHITGREKHLYSLYSKMQNKNITFSEIMDVYAFRIIAEDIDTCYRILGAVHQVYKPVPERFKDYIAIPKANGYQSLHTTLFGPYGVPIEIQIRTQEMENTAENGIAAHWLYKSSGKSLDKAQLRARTWLKGLLEMQESSKNSLEFIENVKFELFPDEVYVFTPKGEIMELPSGATTVDLAYAIHTDLGNSCIAAKIDRRLAPLSTTLVNGQTVEIITAPGARPNPAWLNFAITGKAKSNIRHLIKEQRHSESVSLGKQLLEKALSSFSISFDSIPKKKVSSLLKQYNYESTDGLYEAIGTGEQPAVIVAHSITDIIKAKTTKKKLETTSSPLTIKGVREMAISFAECCRPIPGDPIIGVFNNSKGFEIHTEECSDIAKFRDDPERCTAVQWETRLSRNFKANLIVEVANQQGVLAKLANAISNTESNIDDISVDAHDGRFTMIKLIISVKDMNHLSRVMRRINAISAVTKVCRK